MEYRKAEKAVLPWICVSETGTTQTEKQKLKLHVLPDYSRVQPSSHFYCQRRKSIQTPTCGSLTNIQVKLISGEIRYINRNCLATIGVLSNPDQKNIKLGKAGRKRYLGFRPKVRGVVMNPVDHPHGGGEGKTSGGRDPVSPWGQSAKGLKTRNNKRTNKYIILRRKRRN